MKLGTKMSGEAREKMRFSKLGDKNPAKKPESRAKMSISHRGEKNSSWKGGRYIDTAGYVRKWNPDHPFADKDGYVLEHRLVMEAHLGRVLLPTEVVHHINGILDDNRIENLMLFSSSGEHSKFHKLGAIRQ